MGDEPMPSELAASIISAVGQHVEFELEPIRAELLQRLEEPSDEYIWPRAERIAAHAIGAAWSVELVEQCERGLAEAHELFLRAAGHCLEAADELGSSGAESWIARAIRHRLAFDVVWATLDERHGVEWHECQAGG
jgi:hypothetical protein